MFDATKIRDKLVGSKDERAVSPVIGVILMVAITVILAAVIAAFVLDLGDTSANPSAGIQYDYSDDDDWSVTLNNIERLDSWEVSCAGSSEHEEDPAEVGQTIDQDDVEDCDRDDIQIIGTYDGEEAVLS
ncbi:type IV pilin [Halobiforma nitratireducens]|uniref:Archaeal Type IV pilin N-terminal domain-containing protein n=1 Tax=Halobiforma nitratireducens JCM 10879 TaxID=1227454 RepID=M0MAL8_9EURY|nr:type IV pilin N-terminal domain-containing protein [Halobiforma nitratireducens]EMA41669.1 hypothetical protein C446_05120 [Halobiforma nitratireducens JCM 10879]